jgi:ADP-ribosylation factor-like protein 2
LGLDNAGKTTVLKKYCHENIDEIEPTIGFNIQTIDHSGYTINLWDVGGQKSIRAYWRNYYEKTDGIIWVIDSADVLRMDMCRVELDTVVHQERLAGASLLILANKQDVVGATSPNDIASFLELHTHEKYSNRHWKIQPCSAVTGDGLRDGIDWIVEDIGNRIFLLS